MVGGCAVVLFAMSWTHGDRGLWLGLASLGFPAVLLAILYVGGLRRPPWKLAGGGYARVGRVRGLYYTAGKPVREFIGRHFVTVPSAFVGLVPGRDVEVEVCPALEDYPGKNARVVLSDADGTLTVDGLMREGHRPFLNRTF